MMRRSGLVILFLSVMMIGARAIAGQAPPSQPPGPRAEGWTIPPEAKAETNPIAPSDQVLADGHGLYKSRCQRCHGPEGKGDGPDAEPEHAEDMDLTRPGRASRNPDGVVFYKIWNGRKDPEMPALNSELTRDDVWTLVTYVQTLRKR